MPIATTCTRLRAQLASTLDRVVNDREVAETAHLLRSPNNARRLLSALRRADRKAGGRSRLKSSAGRWDLPRPAEREAVFHPEFREDLRRRVQNDRNPALRVLPLIEAVLREPFPGIGRPEPLKYVLARCWSRRITQDHRLVYKVSKRRIDFPQARYQY